MWGGFRFAAPTLRFFADYNAFRGGLKSALRRTFLTTKDTKGAQRAQSLNLGHKAYLHVQAAGYV